MVEYDCRSCKRWKHCLGKEWYHYGEIRWCPHQIIWIWQNRETLDVGIWVVDKNLQDESDRRAANEAYFVKSKIAIGEVRARLAKVPSQGEILLTQIEDRRSITTLSDGAYEVLMYVKGWQGKRMSFIDWQRQKKKRKMSTQSNQNTT